jgi:hypothetical protein
MRRRWPTEMILTLPTNGNVAKFEAYSAAPDLRLIGNVRYASTLPYPP